MLSLCQLLSKFPVTAAKGLPLSLNSRFLVDYFNVLAENYKGNY